MLNKFKQIQKSLNIPDSNNNDDNDPNDKGLLALQNRDWNTKLGAFVSNFRGGISVAYVNNFQHCDIFFLMLIIFSLLVSYFLSLESMESCGWKIMH